MAAHSAIVLAQSVLDARDVPVKASAMICAPQHEIALGTSSAPRPEPNRESETTAHKSGVMCAALPVHAGVPGTRPPVLPLWIASLGI